MKLSILEYNSLLWFIIRGCFIGVSLNNIIYISKQDSTISVLLAILLGFIPLMLYFFIRNYEPNLTIADKNKLLFNRFGKVINIFEALLALGFSIMILGDLTHFISSQFLYHTSSIIISISFMILIVYALLKGLTAISKASLIVFYICIIIALLIMIGLIFNINITNFQPILYNGLNPVFKSSLIILAYNILPIFFLLAIPKNNVRQDNTKINIIFYLISMLSILNTSFMTIAIFGVDLSLLYEYPGFHLLRQVNIGEFVDRIEIFLSIEWIISMCIMLMFCLYFCNYTLKKTLNITIKQKWKLPSLLLEATILVLAQIFIVNNFLYSSSSIHDTILYTILIIFGFLYLITAVKVLFKKA